MIFESRQINSKIDIIISKREFIYHFYILRDDVSISIIYETIVKILKIIKNNIDVYKDFFQFNKKKDHNKIFFYRR